MIRILLLFSSLCVLLTACTSVPKGPEQAVNLTAQLQNIAQITRWQMRGKIAYRQGKEAASLNLVWKNDSGDFDFRLTNFLGVTLVDLTVNDEQSILEADGETYVDARPEPLIYQITGMMIPVAPLLSWVKGLPMQGDEYTLTDTGLVNTLESRCHSCRHWQVSYDNYGNVQTKDNNTVWLPHTIVLTQAKTAEAPMTQLKIKIYQWTLN